MKRTHTNMHVCSVWLLWLNLNIICGGELGSLVGILLNTTGIPLKNKFINLAKTLHPARLSELTTYLLKDAAISGKLIIAAVILALIATNTALRPTYEALWNTSLTIGLGHWSLSLDLRHWINDALMALFFLVVGLELKREFITGELRKFKTAILPIAAAIGGMVVPALIYISLNVGGDGFKGWAIPMATDIAIVIGLLALLGKRVPSSIRLFLLTLAIVDDVAAVIVIAVFYSSGINIAMLCFVAALSAISILLQKSKLLSFSTFVVLAVLLWLLVNVSGIHPSIAGALIGLLAPLSAKSGHEESIAERLERFTIPISTLLVVPIFAFANAGIPLSLSSFQGDSALPIAGGIILSLVVGKVVGIVGASWLMIKLGASTLPSGSNWNHIIGVGMLAGIGFTVSIFVTELAFDQEQFITISKLAIFLASILSGFLGLVVLRYMIKPANRY